LRECEETENSSREPILYCVYRSCTFAMMYMSAAKPRPPLPGEVSELLQAGGQRDGPDDEAVAIALSEHTQRLGAGHDELERGESEARADIEARPIWPLSARAALSSDEPEHWEVPLASVSRSAAHRPDSGRSMKGATITSEGFSAGCPLARSEILATLRPGHATRCSAGLQ
jgi:hypothetical protein